MANNPNFGFRVVTEYQSTATYGISLSTNAASTNYLGTANSFTSGGLNGFGAGTVTYDLVTVSGDAITNAKHSADLHPVDHGHESCRFRQISPSTSASPPARRPRIR